MLLGLALLSLATMQAFRPDVSFPFAPLDEPAHLAYATYLRVQGRLWPDFDDFPLIGLDGRSLGGPNYINHPPLF